jgi:iron complex outermembrane receptor protein
MQRAANFTSKHNSFLIFCILILISGSLVPLSANQDSDEELEKLLSTKVSRSELYSQKISESPNSIIIISKEQIKLFGYQSLSELISTIQGTYIRNDMNYEFLGTRGFDRPSSFSNNLVLLNGHVLNEFVYGSQTLDNYLGIDMDDISRVEILQGSASTTYGSGAMVSLINIVLKEGKEFDGLTVGLTYGTYDDKYTHLSYGKQFDDFSLAITGRFGDRKGKDFHFEEFEDSESDGIARGMDWEKHYATTIQADYKDFSFNIYFSNREKSIPNAPYESDFNTAPTKSRDVRACYSLMYQHELAPTQSLKAKLYFDTYDYSDVFQYEGEPLYDENIGRWYGMELDYKWDISSNYSLLAGTNFTRTYKLTNKLYDEFEVYDNSDMPFTLASFYIQNNYQIMKNLSINFGLRADLFSYHKPQYNPRLAFIYNPSENTTLKYILNSGFRIPSVYEFFVDDTTFKPENLGLKPESLLSNEIIWENIVSKHFNYSVSVYHYSFRNIIELVHDPDVPDYGGSYENMPHYNSLGIELALRGRPGDGFVWYSNFAYQMTQDSSNKQITNSPQFLAKAGLAYSFTENMYIGIESKYESNRRTLFNTTTDEFFLIDANIGFTPNFSKESGFETLNHIHLGLRVKNLLDKNYYLPGPNWVSTQSIEQYGRVITFIIKVKV